MIKIFFVLVSLLHIIELVPLLLTRADFILTDFSSTFAANFHQHTFHQTKKPLTRLIFCIVIHGHIISYKIAQVNCSFFAPENCTAQSLNASAPYQNTASLSINLPTFRHIVVSTQGIASAISFCFLPSKNDIASAL